MAIYIVTGKLGGGKTLAAVSKIDAALAEGRKVATNLDLNMCALPSCSRKTRSANVTRLPDRPSVDDIQSIGFGIENVYSLADARRHYDESRFGVLVLDECGTWLNSRDWQAEGRRELINFLLHIRKHLWDVYLIIQDISMLDKQARKALAEHVVYCRRTDRMSIPIISTIFRWMGGRLPVPRMHVAHVKYGDQPTSLTVDKWWYRGDNFFDAYDTTQVFTEDYAHGPHTLLPPYFQYFKSFTNWNWKNRMRLTRIYLRQHSLIFLCASSLLAGSVATYVLAEASQPSSDASIAPVGDAPAIDLVVGSFGTLDGPGVPEAPFVHRLRLTSFSEVTGRSRSVEFTADGKTYSERALESMGLLVRYAGPCHYVITDGNDTVDLHCYG
jgi:hypothetical protein